MNLKTNKITPTTYFNMSKKTRGVLGEKKLMEMDQADFTDPFFIREITRCTLSRLEFLQNIEVYRKINSKKIKFSRKINFTRCLDDQR